MSVKIMLCTNDENGNNTERVFKVAVYWPDGEELELDTQYWEDYLRGAIVCRVKGDTVKLSRRRFPILGHKDWVGNWCWRCVWVEPFVADSILRYLASMKKWQVEAGTEKAERLWERFDEMELPDPMEQRIVSTRRCPHCGVPLIPFEGKLVCANMLGCEYSERLTPDIENRLLGPAVAPRMRGF